MGCGVVRHAAGDPSGGWRGCNRSCAAARGSDHEPPWPPGHSWGPIPMISIIRPIGALTRRSTSSSCPPSRACLSPSTIARTPELSMNSSPERSSRIRGPPSRSRRSRSSTVSATAISSSPTSASRTTPSASRFSRISKDGPASAKSADGVGFPAKQREEGAILATGGPGKESAPAASLMTQARSPPRAGNRRRPPRPPPACRSSRRCTHRRTAKRRRAGGYTRRRRGLGPGPTRQYPAVASTSHRSTREGTTATASSSRRAAAGKCAARASTAPRTVPRARAAERAGARPPARRPARRARSAAERPGAAGRP